MTNTLFKRGLVLFWTIWWLIELLNAVLGSLKSLGILHVSWIYSVNYPTLVQALALYPLPNWVPPFLYIGIVLWVFISTILFIRASVSRDFFEPARVAFIVSMALWLAFFIGDDVVLNYNLEQNHMVQGGFEFLSFLAMYILPE